VPPSSGSSSPLHRPSLGCNSDYRRCGSYRTIGEVILAEIRELRRTSVGIVEGVNAANHIVPMVGSAAFAAIPQITGIVRCIYYSTGYIVNLRANVTGSAKKQCTWSAKRCRRPNVIPPGAPPTPHLPCQMCRGLAPLNECALAGRTKQKAGRSPLSLTVTGTCRVRCNGMLHVHSAHAAHAAARRAMRMLVFLRRLSDHDLCREQ